MGTDVGGGSGGADAPGGAAVPAPLGWCVPHLRRSERVPAVALSTGTSMCEDCAVAAQEDLDALPERLEEEVRAAAEQLFGSDGFPDDVPDGLPDGSGAPPLRLVLGARDRR